MDTSIDEVYYQDCHILKKHKHDQMTKIYSSKGTSVSKLSKKQPKKSNSLKKRIAALIGTGLVAIGSIALVHQIVKSHSLPEENDHIFNTSIDSDTSDKQKLLSILEDFDSISKDSRSEDINAYAQSLYETQSKVLSGDITNAFNSNTGELKATSAAPRKYIADKNDPVWLYRADLSLTTHPIDIRADNLELRGDYLRSMLDSLSDLEEFDVYHDGFGTLEGAVNKIKENLSQNHVLSYDSEKRSITSYTIEKEQTQSTDKEIEEER